MNRLSLILFVNLAGVALLRIKDSFAPVCLSVCLFFSWKPLALQRMEQPLSGEMGFVDSVIGLMSVCLYVCMSSFLMSVCANRIIFSF